MQRGPRKQALLGGSIAIAAVVACGRSDALEDLFADPILKVAPPGASIPISSSEADQCDDLLGPAHSPPHTTVQWPLAAEPAAVVEFYREAANEFGWTFVDGLDREPDGSIPKEDSGSIEMRRRSGNEELLVRVLFWRLGEARIQVRGQIVGQGC